MQNMLARPDRRVFLKVSAAVGGGLALGFALPDIFSGATAQDAGVRQLTAWVRIAPDGIVTIESPQSEMGQGILTALPMIIADEMDADWSKVRYHPSSADPVFNNPFLNLRATGGSASVRFFYEPLRKVGATVRAMLIAAAADSWKVDAVSCRTENGAVIHSSGKRATYGELAALAAKMTVPAEPKLKDPKNFSIIGKPIKRMDTAAKVNGSAPFAMDVKLPGILTALVARPPTIGGKVASFNGDKAKAIAGVKAVVPIPSGVAVVADGFWPAKKGRDALEIKWDAGPNSALSSDGIRKAYIEASSKAGVVARKDGDVAAAKPAKTVAAVYEAPFLAHACMEPMNCTAWVKPEGVEIWAGTQFQTVNQLVASQIAGVKPDQVTINTTFLGGGFGRRVAQDFIVEAVVLSKATGAPVRVVFTREDDMHGQFYRPAWYTSMSAGLDASGMPVALTTRSVGPSIMAVLLPHEWKEGGLDPFAVEGLANWPYDTPNVLADWVRSESGVGVWVWRSVGNSQNGFTAESFVDELAQAAGKDPFEYRRALLAKHPRHKGALELAAEKAGWGKPLAAGRARGIAVVESFESYVAQVAEVSIDNGQIRVHRVVCAIDCGTVINPDTVKAQMESGIIFGLSAALYGAITIKDGRVEQSNFDTYPVVRMDAAPAIEVHIVSSTEKPGGVGEPGTPPIAPAVANAVFALTGKRLRKLPFGTMT